MSEVEDKLRDARNKWFLQACGLLLRVQSQEKALKEYATFTDEIAAETGAKNDAAAAIVRQLVDALEALRARLHGDALPEGEWPCYCRAVTDDCLYCQLAQAERAARGWLAALKTRERAEVQ